jgi:hypothetical protein
MYMRKMLIVEVSPVSPSRRKARDNRPAITEEDLHILEPIFTAARSAVVRTRWRLGDPIEELTGFIALVVIAEVSKQLQEIGMYEYFRESRMEVSDSGPDDCGFYSSC